MNYLLFCSHELISLLLGTDSLHLRSEFSVIRNLILTPFPHSSQAIINYIRRASKMHGRARAHENHIENRADYLKAFELDNRNRNLCMLLKYSRAIIQLKLLYISWCGLNYLQ
jgi:hypothetical protein